jgi:phosphoglycolate phosphatase
MTRAGYDFWLLDLDGTLVDIEQPYIYEVFDTIGTRLDVTFTDRESELVWYGIGEARNDLLAEKGVSPERFWNVFHEVEDPDRRTEATYLYDDASTLVPSLSGPVGIVTHCQSHLTEPVLSALDIGDWFDTVVCCTDETGWKPDPQPVRKAMDDLGVGDDPQDIGAARNAGLEAVHVRRRAYDRLAPSLRDGGEFSSMGADRRVASLAELASA